MDLPNSLWGYVMDGLSALTSGIEIKPELSLVETFNLIGELKQENNYCLTNNFHVHVNAGQKVTGRHLLLTKEEDQAGAKTTIQSEGSAGTRLAPFDVSHNLRLACPERVKAAGPFHLTPRLVIAPVLESEPTEIPYTYTTIPKEVDAPAGNAHTIVVGANQDGLSATGLIGSHSTVNPVTLVPGVPYEDERATWSLRRRQRSSTTSFDEVPLYRIKLAGKVRQAFLLTRESKRPGFGKHFFFLVPVG